jgi:peptide/nickel transport system ATP-binding protein
MSRPTNEATEDLMASSSRPVQVEDLRVELSDLVDIVDHVSLSVAAGQVLGIVGESGSGKTTVASALLGYARRGARIASGAVEVAGVDMRTAGPRVVQSRRGRVVAFVPQDPGTALNPSRRIRAQLGELFGVHEPSCEPDERNARIESALNEVRLPADAEFLARFPHQLSGGQQQRICIAMAFLLNPAVIVFDEPTTGLDVTTQAAILDIIRRLCRSRDVAAVYISHDLAVVSEISDRVAVMYAGRIVESGSTARLLSAPDHPYTALLAGAIPDVRYRKVLQPIPGQAPTPAERLTGCPFAPRCPLAIERCTAVEPPLVSQASETQEVACHRAGEISSLPRHSPTDASLESESRSSVLVVANLVAGYQGTRVLHDVSLAIDEGECVAIVGESGSGKTTLARNLVGLNAPMSGTIHLRGESLRASARERTAGQRKAIQYVFQNPYASFNPRSTIATSLTTVIRHFDRCSRAEADERAAAALHAVNLPNRFMSAYPDQLSGGERQRAAVARAIVCDPDVLICDEVTSALDVSVQAAIVRLLADVQRARGLSVLFVTHDLALVRSIADRVVVLSDGRVVEQGLVDQVLETPKHAYTQQLLSQTPRLNADLPVDANP